MASGTDWLLFIAAYLRLLERTTLLRELLSQQVRFTDTLQCLEQSWAVFGSQPTQSCQMVTEFDIKLWSSNESRLWAAEAHAVCGLSSKRIAQLKT